MSRWSPAVLALLAGCIENNFARVEDPGLALSDTGAPTTSTSSSSPACFADTFVFSYPERSDCPWGTGDNQWQINEVNTARVEETQWIGLPADTSLCGLRIRSTTEDLEFDDHVTLVIGDIVLVGGGSGYPIERLPVVDGLYRYDWGALVGTPFADRNAPYWCFGGDATACEVPATETLGPVRIDLAGAPMDALAAALSGATDIPLVLVTFGDDDADDCAHTALTLEVAVQACGC